MALYLVKRRDTSPLPLPCHLVCMRRANCQYNVFLWDGRSGFDSRKKKGYFSSLVSEK
jgi:hypothetical protein